MNYPIEESEVISIVSQGVSRSRDFMASLTEYHGGEVRTEYMITSDIARAFVDRGYSVEVECKNRKLINGMTALKGVNARKIFRAKRTDVVVIHDALVPSVVIEVKIGVRTLTKIKGDLDKIATTISLMKSNFAENAIGLIVFQSHVATPRKSYDRREYYVNKIKNLENGINFDLKNYESSRPDLRFSLLPLQSEGSGIVDAEIEFDGYEDVLGQGGHATCYYAILIRRPKRSVSAVQTFEELKRRSQE